MGIGDCLTCSVWVAWGYDSTNGARGQCPNAPQLPDPLPHLGGNSFDRAIHDRRRADPTPERHAPLCTGSNSIQVVGRGLNRVEDVDTQSHERLDRGFDGPTGMEPDQDATFPVESKQPLVFGHQELVDNPGTEEWPSLRAEVVAELAPPRSAIRSCVRDQILSWKKGVQRDAHGPVGPRTSLVLTALAAANS